MLRFSRLIGTSNLRRFSSIHAAPHTIHENHDETVISERFKSITILRLNRPQKQNAFNRLMLESLARELNRFEQDDTTPIAVIHGLNGNFSCGYDLEELKTVAENSPQDLEKSLIFPYERKTAKPILCGISGACKSIGFEIALMCDIRVVEDDATFGFTNMELGIPHMANGPRMCANLIGRSETIRLLLPPSPILDCNEVKRLGLTHADIVANGTVLGCLLKLAAQLLSAPNLLRDLHTLSSTKCSRPNDDNEQWQAFLKDIKTNLQLNEEQRHRQRIKKLNHMADWELEEYEHEVRYAANNHQASEDSTEAK